MRTKSLTRVLALALAAGLATLMGAGCSCDEDEFNGQEACQRLVDVVNEVLAGCNETPAKDTSVCGYETTSCSDVAGCNAKVDVEACATRLRALPCMEVRFGMYSVAECKDVRTNIAASCAPRGGGSYDDDD